MKQPMVFLLLGILATLIVIPMIPTPSASGGGDSASSCTTNQYASSESALGALTCSLINWGNSLTAFPSNCAANQFVFGVAATLSCSLISYSQIIGHIANLMNETASSPAQCGSGQWQINTAESAAGALTITCSAPNQETASSPSACPNNQWQTQTTESAAGVLTLTCTAPNQETASNPAACTNGQYLTLVTESVAGALTLTCNNVPDVLQTCTATCTISSVTEAVDANSASALTLNLPAAILLSYYIANIAAGTASICAPTGVNLYVGGTTYTHTTCFALNQNYQIFIWSDGTNYFGIATQIQWSSLTGFPANCAAGNYVYGLGATLTCAKPTNMAFTSNTNTCTTTATTAQMAGFGITYTTQATPFIHTIRITLDFEMTSVATASATTTYIFKYGTGTAPACKAAVTGTTVGNTYTYKNAAAVAVQNKISETVSISGLSASTAYWFDIDIASQSASGFIYSLPQITVLEQ